METEKRKRNEDSNIPRKSQVSKSFEKGSTLKPYRLFYLIGAVFIIVALAGIFGGGTGQSDSSSYTNLIISLFLGIAFLIVGWRKGKDFRKERNPSLKSNELKSNETKSSEIEEGSTPINNEDNQNPGTGKQ